MKTFLIIVSVMVLDNLLYYLFFRRKMNKHKEKFDELRREFDELIIMQKKPPRFNPGDKVNYLNNEFTVLDRESHFNLDTPYKNVRYTYDLDNDRVTLNDIEEAVLLSVKEKPVKKSKK